MKLVFTYSEKWHLKLFFNPQESFTVYFSERPLSMIKNYKWPHKLGKTMVYQEYTNFQFLFLTTQKIKLWFCTFFTSCVYESTKSWPKCYMADVSFGEWCSPHNILMLTHSFTCCLSQLNFCWMYFLRFVYGIKLCQPRSNWCILACFEDFLWKPC